MNKTTITRQKHLNADSFAVENDKFKLLVLPRIGAKIASFVVKEKDFELLFQPTKKQYEEPSPFRPFLDFDTSGLDDMLPTIDACIHPVTEADLPDHGEVWARYWACEPAGDALICKVSLELVPLDFTRTIRLSDKGAHLSYSLTNRSEEVQPFLWALHGLCRYADDARLLLPAGEIQNVITYEPYSFDITRLAAYPDKAVYKFYFTDALEEGCCGMHYPKDGVRVRYEYDAKVLPYLGVWITKGGFKGEYNFAPEPTNGYYDALDRAVEKERVAVIGKNETLHWDLDILIETEGEEHGRTAI